MKQVCMDVRRIPNNELKPLDFRHYYIDRTLFELVKFSSGRELAFLNKLYAVRNIKAHTIYYLKENMKAFNFYNRQFNIYYSLAHLEDMPVFSFAPPVRKQQQQIFVEHFMNYFRGIDIGLDFDENCIHCSTHYCNKYSKSVTSGQCNLCEDYESNFDKMYREVARCKRLFDEWKLPYQLKFSGSGFHINFDWIYVKECLETVKRLKRVVELVGPTEEEAITLSKWFLSELSEINNCPSLDTSVADIRRIWKMPYTIDIKTGFIALPLTDDQFADFNFGMVDPQNVVNIVRDRGLLERQGDVYALEKFINEFLLG